MKQIKTIIAAACGISAGRLIFHVGSGSAWQTAAEIVGVVLLIFCAGVLLFSVEKNEEL